MSVAVRSRIAFRLLGRSFLAFVLVPMLALVIDGSRLFYVRGRLQTAAVPARCAPELVAWRDSLHRKLPIALGISVNAH